MNYSRIPVAGMAVGFARAASEAATAFACRARLGNKELINYQEVQLMIAQMIADTTAARALLWQVARKSFAPRDDEAAICKFYVTDAAMKVCEMAMDLASNHGMLYGYHSEA
jgi:alkylation response protein AidB-like acyl-CoA dehydrogenase